MRKSNKRLCEEYLDYCRRERGRTPMTVHKYGLSLRSLLDHLGPVHLADASTDQLREWVHAPKQRVGRRGGELGGEPAPATVKRKVAELRSLYRWLSDIEGVVQGNPAVKLHAPTVHNENPKPVGDDVWRVLWASELTDSDRVAFGLAFFCGLRRAEVTALSPAHVVQVPKPMLAGFRRKGGKTGNVPWLSCVRMYEERRPDLIGGAAATFTDPLRRLLDERAGSGLLLDWWDTMDRVRRWTRYEMPEETLDPHLYNKRLARALIAAGMDESACSPHMLRHGFGTNMLNMGAPLLVVSRLMGHSSVSITQRYLATSDDPLAELLDGGSDGGRLAVPGPWG